MSIQAHVGPTSTIRSDRLGGGYRLLLVALLGLGLALLDAMLRYLFYETEIGFAFLKASGRATQMVWNVTEAVVAAVAILAATNPPRATVFMVGSVTLALAVSLVPTYGLRIHLLLLPWLALPWDTATVSALRASGAALRAFAATGAFGLAIFGLVTSSIWLAEHLLPHGFYITRALLIAPKAFVPPIMHGLGAGLGAGLLLHTIPGYLGLPTARRRSLRSLLAPSFILLAPGPAFVALGLVNRSPCEVYATNGATCSEQCDIDKGFLVLTCEELIEAGTLSTTAARRSGAACHAIESICAERRAREEARRAEESQRRSEGIDRLIRLNHGEQICASAGIINRKPCEILAAIAHDGRSTDAARAKLRSFLSERGYDRIAGYIVARIDDGSYEAAYVRGTPWGAVPLAQHFLLTTSLTTYSTKGTFALWAKKARKQEVKTTSGFVENWNVYEEDAFGSVVEHVFDAPAGEQTAEAARVALHALIQ